MDIIPTAHDLHARTHLGLLIHRKGMPCPMSSEIAIRSSLSNKNGPNTIYDFINAIPVAHVASCGRDDKYEISLSQCDAVDLIKAAVWSILCGIFSSLFIDEENIYLVLHLQETANLSNN